MQTLSQSTDREIAGLTADSRDVEPGYLFAALPGSLHDGSTFIADAISRGAVAVLASTDTPDIEDAVLLRSENPRRSFALMASEFFQTQPEHVAAITGTNGKSSVAEFCRQLWIANGQRAASLGTLGVVGPDGAAEGSLTTPDPVRLHESLHTLADENVTHLALEASSHGLDQFRLDGVAISIGAFTNLSRDHLDYHKTMDAYLRAKSRLFSEVLTPGGTAVLNADDEQFDYLNSISLDAGHRVISYGRAGTDICLRTVAPTVRGHQVSLQVGGRAFELEIPLHGEFQVLNALCALGVVLADGASESIVARLSGLFGVSGRMEAIPNPSGVGVYVDYAHTPDALETALAGLRPHTDQRLIVVFGCGGDRDRGKRSEMGAVAGRMADRVYVTDDNPRSETPATIRREIMMGCPDADEVGDRKFAIEAALSEARSGDVVLVAGKGHEQGQIIGDEIIPFDDAEVVRALLGGAE